LQLTLCRDYTAIYGAGKRSVVAVRLTLAVHAGQIPPGRVVNLVKSLTKIYKNLTIVKEKRFACGVPKKAWKRGVDSEDSYLVGSARPTPE
jgi:hypothetical protein